MIAYTKISSISGDFKSSSWGTKNTTKEEKEACVVHIQRARFYGARENSSRDDVRKCAHDVLS